MKLAEHLIKNQKYWLIVFSIWTLIAASSGVWNLIAIDEHARMMARERGENFFEVIQLVRHWNAAYGPVYLPISNQTPPNPYLTFPQRDVVTESGLKLTMVNPAYMTRQISELAGDNHVYFHLTSLKPIRPANKPDQWERKALETFHQGKMEVVEMTQMHGKRVFRYMAPLKVQAACLACHAVQGYKIGDIRGGLSVNIDAEEVIKSLDAQRQLVVVVHVAAWLFVTILLYTFLRATRKHTLFLEGVNYAKQKDLQRHKSKLDESTRALNDLVTRDTITGVHTAEHFKKLSSMTWNTAISNGSQVSILLLEVDHFKDFNQNYGALEGDFCLKQVTRAITANSADKGSIVARYGGASFVVMIKGLDAGEAYDVAEKIHGAVLGLRIPHETSEISKYVTVTGVLGTVQPRHGDSITDFVRKLGACLSKKTGEDRNRIHHC